MPALEELSNEQLMQIAQGGQAPQEAEDISLLSNEELMQIAQGGQPQQGIIGQTWQQLNTPLPFAKPVSQAVMGLNEMLPAAQLTKLMPQGVQNFRKGFMQQGVEPLLESLMSPLGIGTLGVGTAAKAGIKFARPASRAISGAFAYSAGKEIPNDIKELSEAYKSGDQERFGGALGRLLSSTGVAAGAGLHAIVGTKVRPKAPKTEAKVEPETTLEADTLSEAERFRVELEKALSGGVASQVEMNETVYDLEKPSQKPLSTVPPRGSREFKQESDTVKRVVGEPPATGKAIRTLPVKSAPLLPGEEVIDVQGNTFKVRVRREDGWVSLDDASGKPVRYRVHEKDLQRVNAPPAVVDPNQLPGLEPKPPGEPPAPTVEPAKPKPIPPTTGGGAVPPPIQDVAAPTQISDIMGEPKTEVVPNVPTTPTPNVMSPLELAKAKLAKATAEGTLPDLTDSELTLLRDDQRTQGGGKSALPKKETPKEVVPEVKEEQPSAPPKTAQSPQEAAVENIMGITDAGQKAVFLRMSPVERGEAIQRAFDTARDNLPGSGKHDVNNLINNVIMRLNADGVEVTAPAKVGPAVIPDVKPSSLKSAKPTSNKTADPTLQNLDEKLKAGVIDQAEYDRRVAKVNAPKSTADPEAKPKSKASPLPKGYMRAEPGVYSDAEIATGEHTKYMKPGVKVHKLKEDKNVLIKPKDTGTKPPMEPMGMGLAPDFEGLAEGAKRTLEVAKELYAKLKAKQDKMLAEGSFFDGKGFSKEWQDTQQKIEDIKGQYGGMPPGEYSPPMKGTTGPETPKSKMVAPEGNAPPTGRKTPLEGDKSVLPSSGEPKPTQAELDDFYRRDKAMVEGETKKLDIDKKLRVDESEISLLEKEQAKGRKFPSEDVKPLFDYIKKYAPDTKTIFDPNDPVGSTRKLANEVRDTIKPSGMEAYGMGISPDFKSLEKGVKRIVYEAQQLKKRFGFEYWGRVAQEGVGRALNVVDSQLGKYGLRNHNWWKMELGEKPSWTGGRGKTTVKGIDYENPLNDASAFMWEANFDKALLQQHADKIKGKWDRADKAMETAMRLLNDPKAVESVKKLGSLYLKMWEMQREAGVPVPFLERFLSRVAPDMPEQRTPLFGPKKRFTRSDMPRTAEYLADRIAAGEKPEIGAGQNLERYSAWAMGRILRKPLLERMKSIKGSEGEDIFVDPIKTKRADGSYLYETPKDYKIIRVHGEELAVHENYAKRMTTYFDPDAFQSSVSGRLMSEIKGTAKSGALFLDAYHINRVNVRTIAHAGFKPHLKAAQYMYEYHPKDLERLVKAGEISAEEAAWIDTNRPYFDHLMEEGLNIHRHSENMYGSAIKNIPGIKHFNKWIFDKLTREAILSSAVASYKRALGNEGITLAQDKATGNKVANRITSDINAHFGNLQRESFFKNPTFKRVVDLNFLAASWYEGLVNSELRAYKDVYKFGERALREKKFIVGEMLRAKATMVGTGLILAEAINMASKGHPTWENKEDGRKWQAYLGNYHGDDFWFDPLFVGMPITAMINRYMGAGATVPEAIQRVNQNKWSALRRGIETYTTGKTREGRPLFTFWDKIGFKGFAGEVAPIPIMAREAMSPHGGYMRQVFATLGIDPEQEGAVSPKAKRIKTGNFNLAQAARYIATEALTRESRVIDPELLEEFDRFNQQRLRQVATQMLKQSYRANIQAEGRAAAGRPGRSEPLE